jgi:hypothetical protein
MRTPLPFKPNFSRVLLAVVSTAFASEASAVAGWVDFASGGSTVSDAQGRQRKLTKGDNLDKGDTVRTNADGRAQIRFTDGAYVSLQPNTEFAIKDYNFDGKTDGSERGIFALARGAMRTVTGLIGRVNRNRYQVSTPTATIGIRGTGGLIAIGTDGSTLVTGTSGIWTLTNPAGTIDVPAGTVGKAPSAPNQPPQQTSDKITSGPPQPPATTTPPYAQADNRSSTGSSASLANPNPPLVTGPGYHVSYAFGSTTASPANGVASSGSLANATFDATGQMTAFTASNSATFTGTHQEFGTAGGVLAWGRWTGPVAGSNSGNFSANEGYHYVVGIPATAMPMTGSAVFTFIGATKPTGMLVALTPGTFTGTLTVTNWATGSLTAGGTVSFASPSAFSYTFSGTGSFSPGAAAFTATAGGMTFNPSAPAGYQCSGGCTAAINGAFFGAGASYAGFAYQITGIGNQPISGTAAFKQ